MKCSCNERMSIIQCRRLTVSWANAHLLVASSDHSRKWPCFWDKRCNHLKMPDRENGNAVAMPNYWAIQTAPDEGLKEHPQNSSWPLDHMTQFVQRNSAGWQAAEVFWVHGKKTDKHRGGLRITSARRPGIEWLVHSCMVGKQLTKA